jgi:hypothetical protein
MGLVQRKKSGNKLNGSRMVVANQGVSNVKVGGDEKINQPKTKPNK